MNGALIGDIRGTERRKADCKFRLRIKRKDWFAYSDAGNKDVQAQRQDKKLPPARRPVEAEV